MCLSSDSLVGPRSWCRVHNRVWDTPGKVIDIGCAGWQWSKQFLGTKEVVGYDPQETRAPVGAVLVSAAVSIWSGTSGMAGRGIMASLSGGNTVRVVSIGEVIAEYSPLAAMKLNIEGGEYSLLPEMQPPAADQLAISFHDWTPETSWRKPWTEAMIQTLETWYEAICIDKRWSWWLFVAKR